MFWYGLGVSKLLSHPDGCSIDKDLFRTCNKSDGKKDISNEDDVLRLM